MRISKTPAFISKCRKALYRLGPPHQSAKADSFCRGGPCRPFSVFPTIHRMVGIAFGDRLRTHPGGSLLAGRRASVSLPHWGRGTARNERWMRDASDKLMLPNFVTLLLQRAYLLGYISQEVRRRSRSDPDHPVNGREGEERAAYVRPVSSSSLAYRSSPFAGRRRSRRGAR